MQGGKSLFEFHSSLNLALPETVQIQADNHLQPAPNHFLSGNAKPQWLGSPSPLEENSYLLSSLCIHSFLLPLKAKSYKGELGITAL